MAQINNFSSSHARAGDTILLTGSGFTNVTKVAFGNNPYYLATDKNALSFTVLSDTQISVVVPANVQGNGIAVFTNNEATFNAEKLGFTYDGLGDAPIINNFSPKKAFSSQVIIITGFNFNGVLSVKFGVEGSKVAATSITVNNTTQITVTIPVGAISGNVYVETVSGETNKYGFVFLGNPFPIAPTISSISPPAQAVGNKVTITGSNFLGTQSVKFGGIDAMHFDVISNNIIEAYPAFGGSNIVAVENGSGSGTKSGFTLLLQQKRLIDLPLIGRDVEVADKVYVWDNKRNILCQGDVGQLPFGSGSSSGGGDGGGGNVGVQLGSPFKVRNGDDNIEYDTDTNKTTITDIRLLGKSDYVVSASDLNGEFENYDNSTPNAIGIEYDEDNGAVIIHNYKLAEGRHITIYADGTTSAAQQAYLLSVKSKFDTFDKVLQPVITQGGTVWPWRKPATVPLPSGWQECTDFRGKMLIGQDPNDIPSDDNINPLNQAVGTPLGGKMFTILKANLPEIILKFWKDKKSGTNGIELLSASDSQIPPYGSKEYSLGGTSKPVQYLPPVRIIQWIEYVG